ncbi:MAG: hypothetical protein JW982_05930 [Spirochaetes bacterium]|nr:hypothetical protein [Spirochaetota bacterium]
MTEKNDSIRKYLSERRMCSAENLALKFGIQVSELWPQLEELSEKGIVRIAQKNCSGTCSSCSTDCIPEKIDPTAIIISLEKREAEDVD